MAEEWRNLSEDAKDKYRKQEAQDKARYQADKAKWEKANPGSTKKSGGKGQKREGPARPSSAFFFFQADRRDKIKEENPSLSHKEAISVSYLFEASISHIYRNLEKSGVP